ncbi:MAG: 3-oxoacyl-[acyl-carrier-protein] reductase [Candidatus Aminicenantes bacterium]|nr:3-oxoacyl-[acyl-carrier-protein] reductase [Candidatus Aminicenantes bacterium]
MLFQDKVAIITGASQGIGKKIALTLAAEGAHVCVFDIVQEGAEEVAREIRNAGGNASVHRLDVSDSNQVSAAVEAVVKNLSSVHFLVNNAGITRDNLLMRMKTEEWDSVMNVNLKGVFNCSKAVIRTMMGNRFGRIVNISSVVGEMGNAGQTNYSASKAGVIGFTKSLAREVASRGVTVNALAPGYIETAMTDNLSDAVKDKFMEIIPMKRLGKPEDVAKAVRFLLSEDASYITGQVLNINGGMYM